MNASIHTAADGSATVHSWLSNPTYWPGEGDVITWCKNMDPGTAAAIIIMGVVYLLYGWKIYRWLVGLSGLLLGAFLGAGIGDKAGLMGAGILVGACLCGAAAWLYSKYAVAVLGGVYGAILGGAIWRTVGLEPQLTWSGALTGLVFFGLISFIIFRASVIIYMSLQGAVMLVFGFLGMLYKYAEISPSVNDRLHTSPFLLPVIIFMLLMFGLIFQQVRYPGSAGAGGGGGGGGGGAAPAKK